MLLYIAEGAHRHSTLYEVFEVEYIDTLEFHIETLRGRRHIILPYGSDITASNVIDTLYRDGKVCINANVSKLYEHKV